MRWRRARRRTGWRDFAALAGVLAACALVAVAWYRAGLLVNHTGSIPAGLYRVARGTAPAERDQLRPGGLVAWCLPPAVAADARRRGYLMRGSCPTGTEPVFKYVAAVAGDTVAVTPAGLRVNGQLLANSRPAARDSRGRATAPVPVGVYPVRSGEAWLWSPYTPLSFDSRYYGAVPTSGLVGRARPIWTAHLPLPPAAGTGRLPTGVRP